MNRSLFSFFAFWLPACTVAALVAGAYGCASIGSPTGGPRDSLPPALVKAMPENFTPNFKSKSIVFNFNEFVELNAVFEKLVINPPLEKFPQVDRKLNTVTIRIKDTLEPNTTYSWRFDGVIRDVNEGNPLGDFTYVFSTGAKFDSATFSGRVLSAETGLVDSTLIVLLHRNLSDTAVQKLKPRYVTKLDGKGFFHFNYLAPGTYNVFALKDEGMKRYTDSTIPFAFHKEPIVVGDSTEPVEMLFFKAIEAKEVVKAGEQTTEGKKPTKEEEAAAKRKPVQLKPLTDGGGFQDIFNDLMLKSSVPLASIDSAQITLTDTLFKPVGPFSVQTDSTGTMLQVKHNWKLETWYQIIFSKGAVTDSNSNSLARNDTLRFRTKGEADYGAIKMEFDGLDFEQYPVLIMLEGGKIYKSFPLKSRTFSDKLFKPGDYEIRILLDTNQNGVWDSGDYKTRRQPERNLAIRKRVTIRANWDNEYVIDVNAREDPEAGK